MAIDIYKGRFTPFTTDSFWETAQKGNLKIEVPDLQYRVYDLLARKAPSTVWERVVSFWQDRSAEWISFVYYDEQTQAKQEVDVNRPCLLRMCFGVDSACLSTLGGPSYLSHFIELKNRLLRNCSQIKQLTSQQQEKIVTSWMQNKENWTQRAKGEGTYFISRRNFVRPLVVSAKGECFILLNRSQKGDRQIGEGCYKSAKLCFALTLGVWAAYTSSTKGDRCYHNEVNILTKLAGLPHILPLWESFVSWSNKRDIYKYCMITTYGNRGTLSEFLCKKTTVELSEKKELCRKLAEGLRALHNKGYIHADVKASNVFVEEKEGNVDLFLADFGLSYEFAYVDLHDSETRRKGTCTYLHPVIARCIRTNDWSCLGNIPFEAGDIWALGVVFYQIANETKTLPWRKQTVELSLSLLAEYAPLQGEKEVFPKPEDETSLQYLAWNMLQVDPKKQFSMQQVVEFLS